MKEVAHELGVSVPSFRRAHLIAEIPAYRISKMLRFDWNESSESFCPSGFRGSYVHAMRDRRQMPETRTAERPPFGKHGGTTHRDHYRRSKDSMSSPFTLTIDWLAFTLPSGSARDTMQMLGGDWTKSDSGFRGYPASWITAGAGRGVGKLGTRAPRAPLEVHVDLSAGIVAPWPTGKVRTVLQWILKQDGHLTRLDCALDDRNSCVPLSRIRQAIATGQGVTRADRMQSISSSSIHKAIPSGETLYLGSPHSQTLLRIYDKRLELQAKEREEWQDYGIRWELELKKDRAQVCGQVLSYLEETDWLEFIVGVLRGYVDFRATSRDEEEEFRYRAPLLDWWLMLTDGFKKGRLVVEKEAQTLPKVKRWVSQSVAPMLAVIYAADPDGHAWLDKEIVKGKRRWNGKHRGLLESEQSSGSNQDAGGHAGAPFQGDEGVS